MYKKLRIVQACSFIFVFIVMKAWVVVVGIIVVIVLVLMGRYNGFVTAEERVETAWSQVENQYQRRSDLIPNLVNTVQ